MGPGILGPGVQSLSYILDKRHRLLAQDAASLAGPNIGTNGDRLTLSFLTMGNLPASLRLLQSISKHMPGFAGEVLVLDNGCTQQARQGIQGALASSAFRSRLIELEHGTATASGCNQMLALASTDWLMRLDPESYFLGNPLPTMQRGLSETGSHFLNLPLLQADESTVSAMGGHLYLGSNGVEVRLEAASPFRQLKASDADGKAFMCTHLYGNASLVRCETLRRLQGYDEALGGDFKDIDLSIRIFREGYKVCCSPEFAIAHAPLASDATGAPAREPSTDASILHIEGKHGFSVYNQGIRDWTSDPHAELGVTAHYKIPESELFRTTDGGAAGRRKIALIIDTDNWAFGNIARQIKQRLSDRFEFRIIPVEIIPDINQLMMLTADCDLVHVFWREELTLIDSPYSRERIRSMGMRYEDFRKQYIETKALTTSVYDHLKLTPPDIDRLRHVFADVVSGYTVSSEKLGAIYTSIEGYPTPTAVIEDGVDLERFRPAHLQRFQDTQRTLTVGWSGNSAWAAELEDFKGFHSILLPALSLLEAEGYTVNRKFADRQTGFIPHHRMVDYYNSIDVYICPSKIEGTPNPVLESMACGVPVISTDVGIVPQVFGPLQRSFILPERSVTALADALRKLIQDPQQLCALSAENLVSIKAWDWQFKTERFGEFFDLILARLDQKRAAAGQTASMHQ